MMITFEQRSQGSRFVLLLLVGAPPICWPGVSVLMNAVHQFNFDRMRLYTARLANGCCLAGGELPPETMYN